MGLGDAPVTPWKDRGVGGTRDSRPPRAGWKLAKARDLVPEDRASSPMGRRE
jgi:hypothetical protein